MELKKVKFNLEKVISFEKDMSVDTVFFSRFLYLYSFQLFILSWIYVSQHLPFMTLLGFVFSALFFLFALLLKKETNKKIFKLIFIITSIFVYLIIYIVTAYGVTKGFANFYILMACNVSVYSFGIVFGLKYSGIILAYLCLFFWTDLGVVLQTHIGDFFKFIASNTGVSLKQQVYEYSLKFRIFFPLIYLLWLIMVIWSDYFLRKYQMKESVLEAKLENDLQKSLEKTELQMLETYSSIIKIIDEKDNYTKQHSLRVAKYSRLIAQKYGISDKKTLDYIYHSALLHDIGKIAIPDNIITKNKKLSDEEYEIIKQHTTFGYQILKNLTFCPDAALSALNHHERVDGKGYPSAKKDSDIPLVAKIVSAADVLDAMNSNRVYRNKCAEDYIVSEFIRISGSQIDSKIADIVCALIKEGQIEIIQ